MVEKVNLERAEEENLGLENNKVEDVFFVNVTYLHKFHDSTLSFEEKKD